MILRPTAKVRVTVGVDSPDQIYFLQRWSVPAFPKQSNGDRKRETKNPERKNIPGFAGMNF